MRFRRLVLLSVLVGTVAATSAAAQSSRAVKSEPRAIPSGLGYANSWALVIGINAYQKVTPRLNYAVADARAVAEVLPALGFPRQNIRVLLDSEATKATIQQVLYREFAGMGVHDRLLVFFAGHGETAPIKTGEEGYLLPVDADPDALPLTGIAMDEIRRIGNRVRAKHVLFVMDACFSGFALTRDIVPKSTTNEYLADALREPVVQILTAGRKGERAIEEAGHGLFTRRFLDGLRLAKPEGGALTIAQVAAWIEPRVIRDSNGRMTPQYGTLDGEGQFFLRLPDVDAVSKSRRDTDGRTEAVRILRDAFRYAQLVGSDKTGLLVEISALRAEAGDPQGALKLAEAIDDPAEKATAFAMIGVVQSKTGNRSGAAMGFQLALDTARSIKPPTAPDDFILLEKEYTHFTILLRQIEAGDSAGATHTLGRISDKYVKADALADLANAYLKTGDPKRIQRAVHEALQAAILAKNENALGRIAKIQAESGNLTEALRTAAQIQAVWARAQAFILMANVYAERGRARDAEQMFVRALGEISNDQKNRQWILRDIATGRAKAGDSRGALATVQLISEEYQKALALGEISALLRREGKPEEGSRYFAEALQWGLRVPKEDDRSRVLGMIGVAQVVAGEIDEALRVVSMQLADDQYHLVYVIARAEAERGRVAEAEQWVLQQSSARTKAYGLAGVARGILSTTGHQYVKRRGEAR